GPFPRSIEGQIQECRREKEHTRERVFEFRHPGDRFHFDRVQSKNSSGKPSSGHLQLSENFDQEKSPTNVKKDVDQMIIKRRIAPNSVLDPKNRVDQRIVLVRESDIGPDPL